MKRLLEGLTVLHGTGVVHRDIKPENTLIEPNKLEIHYIDYGGSCLKKDAPCLEKISGTLNYMSPEIMLGMNQVEIREFMKGYKNFPSKGEYPDISWDICKAGDVWALGMVFLELCFWEYIGTEMFGSESKVEKLTNEEVQQTLLSKIPENVRTQENSVLITACLFLLETNWTLRPTAKQALQMFNGKLTDMLLKVTKDDDLERVAKKYALATTVDKNTRVFPSPEVRRKTV
jgi:serine/threonine protein kinase